MSRLRYKTLYNKTYNHKVHYRCLNINSHEKALRAVFRKHPHIKCQQLIITLYSNNSVKSESEIYI